MIDPQAIERATRATFPVWQLFDKFSGPLDVTGWDPRALLKGYMMPDGDDRIVFVAGSPNEKRAPMYFVSTSGGDLDIFAAPKLTKKGN